MPKKQVFGFKSPPRLEQVGAKNTEQMENREIASEDALILGYANLGVDRISGNDSHLRASPSELAYPMR